MHQGPHEHQKLEHNRPESPSEDDRPGLLPQSDPPPSSSSIGRTRLVLVIIGVLLVAGFVALHAAGVHP